MKIGRNDPCWCGSGKPYCECHMTFDQKISRARFAGHEVPSHKIIKTPAQIEGIRESGKLNVAVLDYVAEHIKAGITTEEIDQINAPFDYNLQKMQNGNRGIGLRYVKAMLDSFYEGQTNLFVNCKKGHGTKITILIPVQEELRDKAKVTDTGIE